MLSKIIKKFRENSTALGLLPLSMRMAGPREALWHAIIRKNYGCAHFIIGRDHAGPGNDKNGNPFYGPYDAQELVKSFENELEIQMVMFKMVGYHKNQNKYVSLDDPNVDKNDIMFISGTQLREKLNSGDEIPEWFTYPEITEELRKTYPPKLRRGFTIFFTGLSGSGKSTIAKSLYSKLMEDGSRPVTLLDGDIVRTHLSSELGFSKDHRNLNIRRIGYVASEITKNRGAAICAPIAPYEESRNYVKDIISQHGEYILVHVSTSLEVCEQRDTKGLYKKAKEGIIKGLTGVDDPYEEPTDADLVIDTDGISVSDAVDDIIKHLKKRKSNQIDMLTKKDIICINEIVYKAGDAIMGIYDSSFEVETKSDNSPLTIADKKSHSIIDEGLNNIFPEIPILSEEGKAISYSERKNWKNFWLIDPLDGTKEFIKRNGEFTVNIALISDGFPIFGSVYAPFKKNYIGRLKIGCLEIRK